MKMSNLNYQGIGPRIAAQIVDSIVLLILFFLLGFAMSGSFNFQYSGPDAYPFLGAYFLIFFLYFVVLEGFMGQTLGKKLLKLKVVQVNGQPCGYGPAVVRNILRIIDALPFLYIIGMILISRSDKKQRLGDSVAKTVVVKA
jgi:uncharacterized RDD family membrane protein YckC